MAAGVRAQLADPRLPGGPATTAAQAHVWLLRRDGAASSWPLVALCAVAAMEYGRGVLWARARAAPPTLDPAREAANLAAARFWCLLEEVGLM